MPSSSSEFPPSRKSASHEASDEAERQRIAKMTVEERMLEALRLHALLAEAQAEGAALEELAPPRAGLKGVGPERVSVSRSGTRAGRRSG